MLNQINPSGDDIIDHDQWLKFFLRLTCGSFQQRLLIVFDVFDGSQTQIIRPECVKTILSHVPLYDEVCKFGISHEGCLESQMTRVELIAERQRDATDINAFIDHFFEDNPLGITFKALEELTLN